VPAYLLDSCDAGQVKETVTYYKAAKQPIKVGSNKTILGVGSKGIIKAKVCHSAARTSSFRISRSAI
jgi:hypothetical protein